MKSSRPIWADHLAKLKPGERVILAHMGPDPHPIPIGTVGTVCNIEPAVRDDEVQVFVRWDNGRSLSCICPPDVIIPYPQSADNKIDTHNNQKEPHGGYYEFRWRPNDVCATG